MHIGYAQDRRKAEGVTPPPTVRPTMDASKPKSASGIEATDHLSAGIHLEYIGRRARLFCSPADREHPTDGAEVVVETDGETVWVEGAHEAGEETAHAGLEFGPETAERLAKILQRFADAARDGEERIYP